MPMKKRVLRVKIGMPSGDVLLTETLSIRVRIHKAALALQNRATIEIMGLNAQLREGLITQFTAWNKRQVEIGRNQASWINVSVEAGYNVDGINQSSLVFKGQIVLAELSSPPPNIGVRLTCYTQQIDRTRYITDPAPAQATFEGYVAWAADQMGLGTNYICDTSFNDVLITNPGRSVRVAAALLIDIQDLYKPDIAAFVDDGFLIVKDRDKLVDPNQIVNVDKFIGVPTWNEWGVEFVTFCDKPIKLAKAVSLVSRMNPGVNGNYVITELEYDLTSRDRSFYIKGFGQP